MFLGRRDVGWTALAPGKLNLYLETLRLRDDGYQELETLMVPICFYDSLHFVPLEAAPQGLPADSAHQSDDQRLPIQLEVIQSPGGGSQAAADVPPGERNLVVRALRLLQRESGCSQGARVRLTKRIPIAAGLGGGSSDAAAALQLANVGWNLNWDRARLNELAARLGSDVPFFLSDGSAICRGRGERVEYVGPLSPLWCVLVQPPVGLATAEVYREHARRTAHRHAGGEQNGAGRLNSLVRALRGGRLRQLAGLTFNRLQESAAVLSPWTARLQGSFAQAGFVAHQLTGSGAAYFGVCYHRRQAICLAHRLSALQLGRVFVTSTFR